MKPILYSPDEASFSSYGLGVLTDAVKCEVSMQKTSYELTMQYPAIGQHFGDIAERCLIMAKPCQTDDPQPFRIYRITKPSGGVVTVYARHISYDLTGYPVAPFSAISAADYAQKLKSNAVLAHPFSFETDLTDTTETSFKVPQTTRYLLSENNTSWQEIYGGELVFDRYKVKLLRAAGADRGVVIRYGVDLIDTAMEENIAAVYTGILPYFRDDQNDVLVCGTVQNASGNYGYTKIMPVDVSQYIAEDNPTQAKVNEIGQRWLLDNDIGKPQVSLTLSYAQIDQIVRQYDTVTVRFVKLGIDVKAKVSETVFDVLRERYVSISVGDVRSSFSEDIADASRLRKGLLPVERIKNRSIGSSKLATNAVVERSIGKGEVKRAKIADKAIDTDQLEDHAVTENKLDELVVQKLTAGDIVTNNVEVDSSGHIYSLMANHLNAQYYFFQMTPGFYRLGAADITSIPSGAKVVFAVP